MVVTERVWTENQASIETAIRDTTDVCVLRGVADAERFASTMDGKQRFGCVGLLAHGNFDETTQTAELLGMRVSVDPESVEPKRLIVNDIMTVIRGYTRHRHVIFACDIGNGVAVRNLMSNADAVLRFPGGISLIARTSQVPKQGGGRTGTPDRLESSSRRPPTRSRHVLCGCRGA